jgi:hypothetical protein
MTSTAVGLGQITKTTLGDAFDRGEYPVVTDEAKRVLASKGNTEARHRAVSSSPRLQIESVFHVFNLKNRYAGDSASLTNVVARYDQDGEKDYVRHVSRCVGDIKTKSTHEVYKDIQKK